MRKMIVLCCLAMCLTACQKKTQPLTADNGNLRISMQNYFATDAKAEVVGKVFQAKLLSCEEVVVEGNGYTYYVFRIVFAPVTDQPLQLQSINISPVSDVLSEYYTKYSFYGPGSVKDYQIGNLDPEFFTKWNQDRDMIAFEVLQVFSNMGDSTQERSGIIAEQFREEMRTINLVLGYNNRTEELVITYPNAIETVVAQENPAMFVIPFDDEE